MNKTEMLTRVKEKLRLKTQDYDLLILDTIDSVCDYCNFCSNLIPENMEPFIRKKTKGMIDYESVRGYGYQPEISSIKEGDGSITWAQTEGNTKVSIYSLNETDKRELRRHRRLRGYD